MANPTEIRLRKEPRLLVVSFDDGSEFEAFDARCIRRSGVDRTIGRGCGTNCEADHQYGEHVAATACAGIASEPVLARSSFQSKQIS